MSELAISTAASRREINAPLLLRSIYVGCMAGSTLLSFGKIFLFALILDTSGFGQYNLALLILSSVSYLATAGLAEGLGREVPMLRGQGRVAEAVHARNASVLSGLFSAGIVGALCAAVLAVLGRTHIDYRPLPWVGLVIAMTLPCNLLLTDLTGRECSTEYSLMLLLKNAIALLAGGIGIMALGVSGALLGEVVSVVLTAVVVICFYSRDIFVGVGRGLRAEAWRVARIGFPFMLSSVVLTLTLSMDRWFVQSRFGVSVFGAYAFAFLVWTAGMVFSNMLSVYLHPRIVSRYARTGDLPQVFAYVRRLGLFVAALFVVAAVPALWVLSRIIDLRYPQYAAVKPLLIPVYLGTMFWSTNFYVALFVIRGDGRIPFWLSLANAVPCAVALAVAVLLKAPLLWYAIIFCACRLIYLVSSIWTAHRVMKGWTLRAAPGTSPAP